MLHTRRKPAAPPQSSAAFTSAVPTPILRDFWWTKTAISAEAVLSAARKQCPTTSPTGENAATFTFWPSALPIHSQRSTRRQTKRRAEWVKPVIHGDQQVPLRWANPPDLNIGVHCCCLMCRVSISRS